jgi:hypothetical protein
MESIFLIVCEKLLRYVRKLSEPDKEKGTLTSSQAISTCTLVQQTVMTVYTVGTFSIRMHSV